MRRRELNKATVFKFAMPVLAAAFILAAHLSQRSGIREGSVELLANEEYVSRFVSDVASAKKSVKCAMYMFRTDGKLSPSSEEPTDLIAAALIKAAKRGAEVSILLDTGESDELTTKYNKSTGRLLEKNGVSVKFDDPKRRLHAKMCVIDDSIVYAGSHNYTYSAMKRNAEVSLRTVSGNLAKDATDYIDRLLR